MRPIPFHTVLLIVLNISPYLYLSIRLIFLYVKLTENKLL